MEWKTMTVACRSLSPDDDDITSHSVPSVGNGVRPSKDHNVHNLSDPDAGPFGLRTAASLACRYLFYRAPRRRYA